MRNGAGNYVQNKAYLSCGWYLEIRWRAEGSKRSIDPAVVMAGRATNGF